MMSFEFGFFPRQLHFNAGPVTVEPLPDLDRTAAELMVSPGVDDGWIYAPPQQVRDIMSGAVREKPYPSRVFGLPKSHRITHASATSEEQLRFHVWALSFFLGMRLSTTEAGYLDATPLKPGALVDFVMSPSSLVRAVELAEDFWNANASDLRRAQRFAAAVHALFLGQSARNLQFESFIYLYTALDACFALAASLSPPQKHVPHADRIAWLCRLYGITPPAWADRSATGSAEVAVIRNDAVHEALFMDAPLGFALHGIGTDRNLTLEMEALACRLLVALIGGSQADYVRTPVDTRQRYGLDLV